MKKIFILALAMLLCVFLGHAQTRFWVASTAGNWNNPSNWSAAATGPGGAGVPTSAMSASFTSNFNGDCILDVAPTVLNITMSTYTGTIDLNGNTLSNTGTATFTSGTISNSGAATASVALGGTTTIFNGTLFNASVTGSSSILNFNGSTFNGSVNVTKVGATNDNGTGGNTFNGPFTITNTGTVGQVQMANTNPDIFNNTVTINSNGTAALVLSRGAAGTQFNQNIVVNYNATGTVAFGSSGGSCTLLSGRTLTIGTIGSSGCGNLTLSRFTAPASQTFTLTGNNSAILTLGPSSTFGTNLTVTSPGIIFNSTTVQGVTQLTKTGSTDDGQRGGNVFNGPFTLNNNGDADIRFGSTASDPGDTWVGDATFNNTSGNRIRVGEVSTGNVFMGNATFNCLGGGTDVADRIQVSRLTGAETTFNGTTTFNNAGVTSDMQISYDPGTLTTFNGPVFFNETTTGAADDYLAYDGSIVFNNDITFTNTSSNTIYISFGSGPITLGNGSIKIGGGGFNNATLRIANLTQTGTATQSITLTGTALLRVLSSAFNGNVDFRAPQLLLDGATYGGTTNNFEKTGATNNQSSGGNTFNGTTTITNSGSGYFQTGNGNADQFNGPTIFNNTGSYRFYFAYNHPGQTTNFASTLTINSNKTGGADTWSVFMADASSSAVNIAGNLLINCGGALRSDLRFLNGTGSSATYGGTVTINSTNSFNSTQILMGNSGTSTYNGNIVVSNINGGTQMLFNNNTTASSTLAAGKTISVGGAGFVDGILSLERFTQTGPTPQTLNTLTGTAQLVVGPNSAFGGNVDFKAPQLYLNGCNYGGTASIEKTGAADNAGIGGNTFAGTSTITNSGSGYLMTGNGSPDQFNGTTTFNNTGSYRIYFGHNHAGQATTFAGDVTMNSNKTGGADNWSFFYGENTNTQVVFGGNLTINCGGSLRSDHRILNGAGSSAIYTGTFTINNTNAHPATALNFGMNGTSTYNGNIVLSNTNGATQMLFNVNASASSILAATRSISIGAAGFAGGTVNLPRFTQIGSTQQTMSTFSSGALLIVGPNSQFDGNVDFRAPQIQLQGCIYGGTTYIEKNGATDNTCVGGNTFAGVTTITNSGSGQLILGNTTSDQFNGATTFNNTGSHRFVFANTINQTTTFGGDLTLNSNRTGATDQWSYLVCENANGKVIFGGNVTINCLGASRSDFRFLNGVGTTASYAGVLTINLGNTNASTAVNLGTNGVSTYSGDISVSNAGSASGIFFNINASANSTLAATKTISIGGGGFVNGTLSLIRFTQLGNAPVTLNTFSSSAMIIVGPASALGGNADIRAPQVLLNGCTYGGTAYIEKNGATDNTSTGGDTFQGVTTLVNSSPASFELANTLPEIFNSNLTVNNTGTYRMQIGIGAANNQFNGTTTINHGGTASAAINMIIARNAGSSATFNGPLILNCTNGNNSSGIVIGNDGNATINGNVTVSNTNNGRGIFLAGGNGNVTLANGFTIKDAGAGTFNTGTLQFSRFTQQGGTPQTITITGTALLNITTSQFNGVLNFKAPQVVTSSTTYNANTSLEKTGATDNLSPGANIFNGTATLTNSGSGYFLMGNGSPDTFVGAATFNNTGSYRMYFAHNHAAQTTTFASDVTLNTTKSGGADQYSFLAGENANTRFTVAGTFTINCAGTLRSDHRFLNGAGASAAYNGNVVINMTNSNASTNIVMGSVGTSTYAGNISVVNTSGGTGSGIFFNNSGTASSTLAATKAISIGAGGFTNGTLSIIRFTQTGSTNQTLALTGTAILLLGPSVVFDGNVDFKAPQLLLHGGAYNGTATIEKNGASVSDSNGGNTFAGTTTITNSSGARMRLAAVTGDAYNGSITFVKSGAGAFEPAYALTSTFAGDLTTNANAAMTFGASTGVVEFNGSNAQGVNRVGAIVPTLQRMRMNKTAGVVTLNTNINIGLTATFTSGVMSTTATNYLNFNDDATATAANNTSYVTGPVRKTGNDAFTFPVGADNFYRPIGMSAPGNVAHHFTAQYFHTAQAFGGKTTWDPSFWTVSACDYWILDRTGATPAPAPTVTVTLSWNDAICGGPGYITSLPGLRVARWDVATSKWINHGNSSPTGTTSNGTVTSAAAVSTFSPFALASVTNLNPLPIELTYFDATDLGATVSLDWTTASELNSENFTVQRSRNGLDFDDLTTIDAAGTKVTESKYNFIDESPYSGLSFYRLKQTDFNGDVSYPGITSIHRAGESAAFNVYPNPAGNEVIHFTQRANIVIMNGLDQQVGSAQGVTSVDVSGLTPGLYIIRNQNGQVIKLVKK